MSSYNRCNIIAISSGKGGVGKSTISANLSVSLALSKKEVILIDASFGISNQHAMFGIKSPRLTLNDFISRKKNNLSEVLIDTGINNLKLVSGAGDSLVMANMSTAFKRKLINNIQILDSDYVILDIGPSINFNTIDFFTFADSSIIVTTPEVTAVTNTYSYIRSIIFKNLEHTFRGNEKIIELINIAKDAQNRKQIKTIKDIRNNVEKIDKTVLSIFDRTIIKFQPLLVINMIRNNRDINIGNSIISFVGKNLGIEMRYLGCLTEGEEARDSLEDMKPFVAGFPDSELTANINEIAVRLVEEIGRRAEIKRLDRLKELQKELDKKEYRLEKGLELDIGKKRLKKLELLNEELHQKEYEMMEGVRANIQKEEMRLKGNLEERLKVHEAEKIEAVNSEIQRKKVEMERQIENERKEGVEKVFAEIEREKSIRLLLFQQKMENAEKEVMMDINKRASIEERRRMEFLDAAIAEERRLKIGLLHKEMEKEREKMERDLIKALEVEREKKLMILDEEMDRKKKYMEIELENEKLKLIKQITEDRIYRLRRMETELE